MKPDIIAKANAIVNSCEEGYFSVINQQGYPETATRSNIKPDGIYSCFFSTGTDAPMAESIGSNGKTSVCFRAGSDNVTLIGNAEIIDDMEIKKDLWLDWFINHFPAGPEDPGYCIVRFSANEVSLWIDREQVKFKIRDILKIQSRCGLLCNYCSFKESHNCRGCITTKGNPFYGECPIAVCCQERELEHCGLCDQMPCAKLKEYSCGEGEHCDNPKGSRLEILSSWTLRG
jgi:general stress protein 26